MRLVQNVLESTSVLATESSAIVRAMDDIQQATRESNVRRRAISIRWPTRSAHESTLLQQELARSCSRRRPTGGKLTHGDSALAAS